MSGMEHSLSGRDRHTGSSRHEGGLTYTLTASRSSSVVGRNEEASQGSVPSLSIPKESLHQSFGATPKHHPPNGNTADVMAGLNAPDGLQGWMQLQQLVLRLSQSAVEDRKQRVVLEKRIEEFANLTQQQDRMIEELKAATRSLVAERDSLLEILKVEETVQEVEQNGSPSGKSNAMKMLVLQLRQEKRQRIAAEETANRIIQQQHYTIQQMEERLKQAQLTPGKRLAGNRLLGRSSTGVAAGSWATPQQQQGPPAEHSTSPGASRALFAGLGQPSPGKAGVSGTQPNPSATSQHDAAFLSEGASRSGIEVSERLQRILQTYGRKEDAQQQPQQQQQQSGSRMQREPQPLGSLSVLGRTPTQRLAQASHAQQLSSRHLPWDGKQEQ
jgi:hypothetical protein